MPIKENTLILDGYTLTLEELMKAGTDLSIKVEIDDKNWPKIRDCRDLVDKWANEERCIYGVNTSCGGLVDHLLPKERDNDFQKNLVRSVTTQVGEPFEDTLVRKFMIARANSLCRGFSGIKEKNLRIYLDMINNHVFPVIPRKGSLGTSGDLGPLGCIASVAFGEWKAKYNGKVMPGKEAMEAAGVELMFLNAKEGLSLINGTSGMVGLACTVITEAKNTLKNSDIIAAFAIETLMGRINPFDVRVHAQKYHPGQYATAMNLTKLLTGSDLAIDEQELSLTLQAVLKKHEGIAVADIPVEDAYSIRCTPQFVGPTKEAVAHAEEVLLRELNSSNDNPLIFTEWDTFIHNGHFHGQPISFAMDCLGIAMINLGVVSDRRIDRFMDEHHSTGLPPFLCKGDTGVRMGLMGGQFMTTSLVAENRTLAIPASIQSITSTADFQDIVSFGLIAGRKARKIVENTNHILSFELMCAAQAADLRGIEKLSPAGKIMHAAVRETLPYLDHDKVYIDHMEELKARIESGEFVERVEKEIGELLIVHEKE
ncbi:aromatic amino acid lyase [Desulfobacula toluolica]|uniref:Pal: predicted phenylalanine ammonia-lyase n=1 Tax=Desulfobacula toluolica (strain DSM 7467 / Tol2) TaxID=651182 RepID=K0N7R8_DESTT|nr:aromatic amino acid lyase [Desulfobacula toluolica]CCK79979.1 Pal: predicted phenylalanine ammonia-lyase [Desulfobacula toluolica Tol2]